MSVGTPSDRRAAGAVARTYLFVPGMRPARFAKALAAGARGSAASCRRKARMRRW